MAENYDLRGTVEIDVDDSVRNLMQVSQEMVALDKSAGALGESLAKNAGEGFANVAASAAAAAQHFEDVRKQMDAIKALGPQAQSSLMRAYKMNPSSIAHGGTRDALAMIDKEGQAWERMYDEALRMNEKFNRGRDARDREYQARLRAHGEALKEDQDRTFASYAPNLAATKQREEAIKAETQAIGQLANTRYALYDVATTWTMVSAATLGASGAAVKMGADYDQAFRSVQRTTFTMGADAERLKNQLVDLTTEIPVAFDEVSKIATLGAQMDIPTESLEKFTETVSKFSSTTDVSVDKAAMSLGRLAQLTKTPIDNIDNLASSIYYVGVNSVATEGQILSIAEQIAVSGNLAGLANHEIIALAGSLASLGVQPEAARGAIMRIFANIRQAVDEGGDALAGFANLAGTSADSFAQAWLDKPQQAFMSLVEGLSDLNDAGGNVSGTLKELGFINVRDIRVWELLADNTEVYTKALLDAEGAYIENTALAEGYAVQVDNLNDILTQLRNSFKAMFASVGDSAILKQAARAALALAEGFRDLLDHPVVGTLAKIVTGVTALIGVFGLFQAILARATASVFGLITAQDGMSKITGQVSGGFKGLYIALAEATQAQRQLRLEADQTTAALGRQNLETQKSMGMWQATKVIGGGVGNMLTGMLKGGLAMAGVTAALWGVVKVVEAVGDAMKSAEDRARDFLNSSGGLAEALAEDGRVYEESGGQIGVYVGKIEDSVTKSEVASGVYKSLQGDQEDLGAAFAETSEKVKEQTLAMGENTRELISQRILDEIKDLDSEAQKLASMFDWGSLMDKLENDVANGTRTATESFEDFLEVIDEGKDTAAIFVSNLLNFDPAAHEGSVEDLREILLRPWREIPDVLKDHVDPALVDTLNLMETMSREDILAINWNELYEPALDFQILIGDVGKALEEVSTGLDGEGITGVFQSIVTQGTIASEIVGDLGASAEDTEEDLLSMGETGADAFKQIAESAWGNAASAESALEALGASLYENGTAFDIFSDNGRANLAAVDAAVNALAVNAGEDVELFTANLIIMLDNLEAQGVDTVNELSYVWQYLEGLAGSQYGIDLSTASARRNLINLLQDGNAVKQLLSELGVLEGRIRDASAAGASYREISAMLDQRNALKDQIDSVNDLTSKIASVRDEAVRTGGGVSNAINRGITDAFNKASKAAGRAGGAGKKAGKDTAKSAKEAAKEIRTLTDYVSDLSSVMSSAFEIRFGKAQAEDSVTKIWNDIKNAAEDAKRAIEDAKQAILDADAKIKGLKSDKKILQYQLTVAEEYGDDLRATQIRAELADKNAELSKTELDRKRAMDDLKKAQAEQNKTLKGNSDEALKNRDTILSLVQAYQKQIEALANSGLSTKDLDRETKRLRDEFVRQATQLGFSRTEVNKYAKSFEDMSYIIKNVPKNVTVKTDINPAKRAVQEFIAKKEKAKTIPTTVGKPSKASINAARKAAGGGGAVNIPASMGAITGAKKAGENAGKQAAIGFKNAFGTIKTRTTGVKGEYSVFADGGYTGRGKKWDFAGIVHKGEYVIPQEGVNQATGLPDLNYLGQLVGNRSGGGAASAPATSGTQVVELSARDRRLLENVGNVTLMMDGRQVATAVSNQNTRTATRGAY